MDEDKVLQEETEEAPETTPEVVEAPVEESTAMPEAPQVVGALTVDQLKDGAMERVNACLECQWVGDRAHGVASCPACGGKTRECFRYQVAAVKATDNVRFTGESTALAEAKQKDE